MRELSLENRIIGDGQQCFIVAEIGQNHQGDLNIAKRLIDVAKECGADCVKFQKSCLTEKFTSSALNRPYVSPHSWGTTYGEHKQHLEFSEVNFKELQKHAKTRNILFTASAMDMVSLEFLLSIDVPFIKIGSGDSENLQLIEEAAKSRVPLIISTGMTDLEGVRRIDSVVQQYHRNYALLHCVSSYPTPPHDSNLRAISLLHKQFPQIVVGYSGHEEGYNMTLAAVTLGAQVVERHITLDKNWKGTDHRCSLSPEEFKAMIKGIREIELSLGNGEKIVMDSELPCLRKLGKTLVAAKNLKAPLTLERDHIKIKVAGERGLPPYVWNQLIGRRLKDDLNEDDVIREEYLEILQEIKS